MNQQMTLQVFAAFVGDCNECSFGTIEVPMPSGETISIDLDIDGELIGTVEIPGDIIPASSAPGTVRVSFITGFPSNEETGNVLIDITLKDKDEQIITTFDGVTVEICISEQEQVSQVSIIP